MILLIPDDLADDLYHAKELQEGKNNFFETEKRYIHKNGNIVWILLSVSIVREKNQTSYYIAQIQDISRRKQLEQSLLENEERSVHC